MRDSQRKVYETRKNDVSFSLAKRLNAHRIFWWNIISCSGKLKALKLIQFNPEAMFLLLKPCKTA